MNLFLIFKVRTCSTSGLPCIGLNYDVQSCNSGINCPVDGSWGPFINESDCTASCGIGTKTRKRQCYNQSNGGQPCYGSAIQTIVCDTNISCPSLYFFISV